MITDPHLGTFPAGQHRPQPALLIHDEAWRDHGWGDPPDAEPSRRALDTTTVTPEEEQ